MNKSILKTKIDLQNWKNQFKTKNRLKIMIKKTIK